MRISNFYALFYSLGKVGCTLIKDYQVFETNALLIYSVPDPPRFIRVGGAGYASLCKSLHKLTAQLSTTENNSISPVPLIKNNTVPTSILTCERPVPIPLFYIHGKVKVSLEVVPRQIFTAILLAK